MWRSSGVCSRSPNFPHLYDDIPNTCCNIEVYLFADDTNLSCIDISSNAISKDLEAISDWLQNNKLVLNIEKSVQINLGSASSSNTFTINDQAIQSEPVCKYLGVLLDRKLSFQNPIEYVTKRLSTQSGIISKLRYYVPRSKLVLYYNSNIKSIIQYGLLVYGCCSFSSLSPIHNLQKKILKFIFFRKRDDHSSDLFEHCKVLTVYELYVYELMKFVLRSINKLHSEQYLNDLFTFNTETRHTRNSTTSTLKINLCKTKIQRFSIYFRAATLYNILSNAEMLPANVRDLSVNQSMNFVHFFKEKLLIGNTELVNLVFQKVHR